MLETPHVAAGAAIALKVVNPALAIPIALLSHFALDKAPHWNPHLNIELKKLGKVSGKSNILNLVDSSFALILGTGIAVSTLPDVRKAALVMICSFAAVLPDVVKIPFYYFKSNNRQLISYIKWDKSIQNDANPVWGLFTQIAVTIVSLYWISM